jgi:hypothetical protein
MLKFKRKVRQDFLKLLKIFKVRKDVKLSIEIQIVKP